MSVSVGVNGMSVVHKKSGGVSLSFPDVCKTPSPAGLVPIPYPNIAKSADTAKGSKRSSAMGNRYVWKRQTSQPVQGMKRVLPVASYRAKQRGKQSLLIFLSMWKSKERK